MTLNTVDAILIRDVYAYTSDVFVGILLSGDLLFSTRNYGHPPHSRSLSILSSKTGADPGFYLQTGVLPVEFWSRMSLVPRFSSVLDVEIGIVKVETSLRLVSPVVLGSWYIDY